LKCNYCDNILQKARTLNCTHHVCESCAIQQQNEHGTCKHCMCTYYSKDITNNVVVNNLVETFHDLASHIEGAAQLLGVETGTDGKYKAELSEDDYSEEEGDEEVDSVNGKRMEMDGDSDHDDDHKVRECDRNGPSLMDQDFENVHSPNAKQQNIGDPTNQNEGNGRDQLVMDQSVEVEEEPCWTPTQICMTGYDKATTAKFAEYTKALGIELSSKWSIDSTDILISKSNIQNGKPQITFKVLASILRNIPVVKESFLEDSYEEGRILDFNKYICNYRRVGDHRLFEGLSILFATTSMPVERLRILLNLGNANVLQREEDLQDKDPSKFNERIMICMHETETHRARQLSKEYNCRVISESWVIKCIYPDDINDGNMCLTRKPTEPHVNHYEMDPIMHRVGFEEFDQTLRAWDNEESSDEEDVSDYDSEDAAMGYA